MQISNPTPTLDQILLRLRDDPEVHRRPRGREGILLLVAVLTAVGSFAPGQAPWWFPYVTGVFAAVGVVVLVQSFVWPRTVRFAWGLRRRRHLDRIARDLAAGFRQLALQFGRLADVESSDSFARYAWNLTAHDPAWRAKLPPVVPPWYFATFFGLFRRQLEGWDGTYHKLTSIAQDFAAVVIQFDQVYVRPTLDALRRLDPAQLPEDVRRKVNLLREEYAAFVRQYRTFGHSANSRCGQQAFPEYLEVPEPI